MDVRQLFFFYLEIIIENISFTCQKVTFSASSHTFLYLSLSASIFHSLSTVLREIIERKFTIWYIVLYWKVSIIRYWLNFGHIYYLRFAYCIIKFSHERRECIERALKSVNCVVLSQIKSIQPLRKEIFLVLFCLCCTQIYKVC